MNAWLQKKYQHLVEECFMMTCGCTFNYSCTYLFDAAVIETANARASKVTTNFTR